LNWISIQRGAQIFWAERRVGTLDPSNLIRVMPAEGRKRTRAALQAEAGRVFFVQSAVIFAHGAFQPPRLGRPWFPDGGMLIAADGGAEHCLSLGWTPDVLIGDFDSIAPERVEALAAQGVEIIRHPVDKDATDLELAIELAIDRGAGDLIILGAVGDRWDQSLASFMLLEHYAQATTSIRLIDGIQEAFLIHADETGVVTGQEGDTVSLIPLLGDAESITTDNLAYPLTDGRLRFGSTRGVSNVLLSDHAHVLLGDGVLVCIVSHTTQV
jgi:thiamine pyrophosphokinase